MPIKTAIGSLLLLTASCATPYEDDRPLRGVTELLGVVEEEHFEIARGDIVHVIDDLELRARTIVIDGELVALPSLDSESPDAPDIVMIADEYVLVRGAVCGADGRDGAEIGERGGRGTDITVKTPVLFRDGVLRAGSGGDSGPGAAGGTGGSIHIYGVGLSGEESSAITSGAGGRAGEGIIGVVPPGAGGSSGDSMFHNDHEWSPEVVAASMEAVEARRQAEDD